MPAASSSAIVILSPHRDDAAFSAGALLGIAAGTGLSVTILNVFTTSSYAPFGDHHPSIEAVTKIRLAEDRAVLAHLAPTISLHDLGLLDAPLRLEIRDDQVVSGLLSPERLAEQVARTRAALPDLSTAVIVLVPLALGAHIDHVIARDAGIGAVPCDRIGFYQDLPYASRIPSADVLNRETADILTMLSFRTNTVLNPWQIRTAPDGGGVKRRLVACYPSQVAPETMDEIANWTQEMGGEQLYLSESGARHLAAFLPAHSLTRT